MEGLSSVLHSKHQMHVMDLQMNILLLLSSSGGAKLDHPGLTEDVRDVMLQHQQGTAGIATLKSRLMLRKQACGQLQTSLTGNFRADRRIG